MKAKELFYGYDKNEYRPIIREKTAELLKSLIEKHQPEKVLEIGTFIGYSACLILETAPNCFLTTLEKDKANALCAVENLKEFDGRFEVVTCDALEFLKEADENSFDFIFLDGPKGQYVKYLPFIKKILKKGGVLVADDVMFYGLVNSDKKIEHKHRTIVNNLRKFLDALQISTDFETKILNIEDGISVSKKL